MPTITWNPALRCALRSASFPDWRLSAVLLALNAGACSRDAHSVRLQAYSPSDEIFRISCERDIQACRDEANELCAGRYQVLEATGAPVEPERVSSAPGPRTTGPRYQRPKWVGQMVVACGEAPASAAADPTSASPRAPAAPVALAPDRLCIPGLTQECLGPAACRGAQACLPDGDGYGPCDCGNASTSVQSEPAPADAGVPHRAR
jgi:hypothetical protein